MEQIEIENEQKVEINASLIISKYKNIVDRNFSVLKRFDGTLMKNGSMLPFF